MKERTKTILAVGAGLGVLGGFALLGTVAKADEPETPTLPKLTKKDEEESLALLDECDPLDEDTWREGTVCVEVEGLWALWPAQVPKPKEGEGATPTARQVIVSPDYEEVQIGSSWPIATLDAYLDDAREEERLLVLKSPPPLVQAFILDPMLFLGGDIAADPVKRLKDADIGPAIYMLLAGIGYPVSIVTTAAAMLEVSIRGLFGEKFGEEYDMVMQLAAVAAIGEFCRTHKVQVNGQRVLISDLPPLPGPQRLRKYIADYVVGFMSRTFED